MFSDRIARLRKEKGLNQKELAERLSVSVDSVRRWEQGKRSPDADVIPKLAKALDVSISDLMDENELPDLPSIKKVPTSSTRSSKWMLVYERDGERIELPPTEQGYAIINNIASAIVNRPAIVTQTAVMA